MEGFVRMIIEKLISKKKVIGWVSAALIAITGVAVSMDPAEVKSAICDVK